MTHLFFGLDVRPLGVFPYTAGELDYEGMTPPEGLPSSARVAAPPRSRLPRRATSSAVLR
jgi:hypothetical protein